MKKGGGLGSIAKGLGSKMGNKITDSGEKLARSGAKKVESAILTKGGLEGAKDLLTGKLSDGLSKLKNLVPLHINI